MPIDLIAGPAKHKLYRPSDPDLLNRRETSEYLGVSVGSLAHWSRHEKGPPPRLIGRSSYYHRDDCDAWLASRAGHPRG